MSTDLDKASIRREFIAKRFAMPTGEISPFSTKAQRAFIGSDEFISSKKLALYSSFNAEVITKDIFDKAVELGKEVYFPKVIDSGGAHMEFYRVLGEEDFVFGAFEIPEPDIDVKGGAEKISAKDLDIVVVPGVAFDLYGARLGYGKGFYDKALGADDVKAVVVGLAYERQIFEGHLPLEDHDVKMDILITESRVERF